jgi:methionyl-tRNA formyltransferase
MDAGAILAPIRAADRRIRKRPGSCTTVSPKTARRSCCACWKTSRPAGRGNGAGRVAGDIAGKLSRESAAIDWTRPADEVARRIRWPLPLAGVRVKLCDAEGKTLDTLRLVRARPAPSDEASRWSAGEVMSTGLLRAGDAGVEIVEVQPDGKKPMPLELSPRASMGAGPARGAV